MERTDTKILIKLHDGYTTKWVHLCYVDSELYKEFLQTPVGSKTINELILNWSKNDFGVPLSTLSNMADLEVVKELIKKTYKALYPDLYRDSETDRQGWIRVWITNNMKKEIEAWKNQ